MKFGSIIDVLQLKNVTKNLLDIWSPPKIYIQQLELSILVIIEGCVNQMFFVAWPLTFF